MFSPSSGQKAATGRFLDVVVKHVELPFKSVGGFFVTISSNPLSISIPDGLVLLSNIPKEVFHAILSFMIRCAPRIRTISAFDMIWSIQLFIAIRGTEHSIN